MDHDIADIPAKVDTGAYGSAVHADRIRLSDDGKVLHYRLLGGHPVCGALATDMTTREFKQVLIENSFGNREERYEVRLKVKLGPKIFVASFSLADRTKKTYPILLGRKMLNDRFLVDTGYTQIDQTELKQEYGIIFPADEEGGR